MTEDPKLAATLDAIDKANAQDPNKVTVEGAEKPAELVYGQRMSAWLDKVEPEASTELQIAVRAQHLERFKRPRDDYPMDRAGYRAWRTDAAKYHARRVGEIMAEQGYDSDAIERVRTIVRKENIKSDPEAQALEDCAALVFMAHYLDDFLDKYGHYDEEKLVKIFKRTWKKMSADGHDLALQLELPAGVEPILEKALR